MEFELRDGRAYVVRRVRREDKALLTAGLAHASPESVQRRFLGTKPHLSDAELRYFTEVDFDDHYALVAVLRDAPDRLVAVGRWVRDRADRESAEMAVMVCDEMQGQGVGTRLARLLADAARRRGIRRVTATLLIDNHAARAVLARVAAPVRTRSSDGVQDVVAELGAAPPARRAA